MSRLAVEWIVVLVVTGGLVFTFHKPPMRAPPPSSPKRLIPPPGEPPLPLEAPLEDALERLTRAVEKLPPKQQDRPALRRLLQHMVDYAQKLADQKKRPQ